jgi:superfamily I DNA/RNA helicase
MGEVTSEAYKGEALRVFGPPGTGKTTHLARMIYGLIRDNGTSSVMVSSFSTTAATAIVEKFNDNNVLLKPDKKMVGTLHSHAYRSAGHGTVALDPKVIGDWNAQVTPEMRVTPDNRRNGGDTGSFVSDPAKAVTGDDLLGCLDLLRAKMIDPADWPRNVAEFAKRWTAWKTDAETMDFTDMIEGALHRARDGEHAPGNPQFIVSDESQDQTPLESALLFAWGLRADRLVLAMDDDQAINQWRGGDALPLLQLHGPEVSDHVLGKSFRVPESVRVAAEVLIRRVAIRKDKTYMARTKYADGVDTGEIVGGTAFNVSESLASADLVTRIVRDLDAGKSVMVIASCNYMLQPLITNLRQEGVPFHNPYRPLEGRWNPFGAAKEDGMTTAERVYHYLVLADRDWTGDDIRAWMELVKIKDAGLVTSAKRDIVHWAQEVIPEDDVVALFKTHEAFDWATSPDPDWLASCLLASKRPVAEYPLAVARQHGHNALKSKPRLTIGTIHSVKGAGEDVVYLAPDISNAARLRIQSSKDGRDEAIRLFYVGMTRAKESLRILAPGPGRHIPNLVPASLEVM